MSKDKASRLWGDEQVRLWRRSYDLAPPGGEGLKDTVAYVLAFHCQRILTPVLRGERVLVVAHGNSLRALAMVLDGLTPETVRALEIPIVWRSNGRRAAKPCFSVAGNPFVDIDRISGREL